jgi:hypothetical protein
MSNPEETLLLLRNLKCTIENFVNDINLLIETSLQSVPPLSKEVLGKVGEKNIEDEEEEDDEEEYCPMCGDEIDVASNQWGGGCGPGDYYCVPCYSNVLEGRKTFPQF